MHASTTHTRPKAGRGLRAGSFRSAPGIASSRRTTASAEHDGAGRDGAESFTSARSFGQTSMQSALSNQARGP